MSTGSKRPGVLIASPYLPPSIGGVETYVAQLSTRLAANHGWRVVIATTTPDSTLADAPGVEVLTLNKVGRISNTPIGFRWRAALHKAVQKYDIAVINAHSPVPGMAEAASVAAPQLPLVLTYHVVPMNRVGQPLRDTAMRAYEKVFLPRLARRADHVICGSQAVLDGFAPVFAGRATVISPGVDLSRFREMQPAEPGRLLFVGSLGRAALYKGLTDLLNAMIEIAARYPFAHLDVVGDGDGRADLQSLAQSLGLGERVTFHGALFGESLSAAYSRSVAVVLPTHYDSFPTVLIEGMASHRTVVSTTVGGVPELVKHGVTGWLGPPADVEALTANIAAVLDDPARAVRMGHAGAEAARSDLDWDTQAARTHEVLSDAARRQKRRRRRVAVVTPYFAPDVGGVERYVEGVARGLAASPDLEPVVYTSGSPRRRTTVRDFDGIRVVQLGRSFKLSNTPISLGWLAQVPWRLRADDIELVWANAPVPFLPDLAVLLAGDLPAVLTYHSGSMVKGTGVLRDALIRAYERAVLPAVTKRAAVVVAVSSTSLLSSDPRAVTISPFVDVDVFKPLARTEPLPPTLVYVGRMERSSSWKGVDVLIKAFAEVHESIGEARLVLVGSGDACPDHRELAEQLGVGGSVEFAGALSGNDLVASFQNASVVVLPSLTEAESFGMTLIEAMACERPVVGSAVGGIRKVIRDGVDGLLVSPGDAADLARACERLLRDPALAEQMGRAGRSRVVDEFSAAAQVELYLTTFRETLGITPP